MKIASLLETTDCCDTDLSLSSRSSAPGTTVDDQTLDYRTSIRRVYRASIETMSRQCPLQPLSSVEPSWRRNPNDKQLRGIHSITGIRKRREWRVMCRESLSKHIGERLGIEVAPSAVRLMTGGEDMPYAWHISDPSIKPLFEKSMSKHSVGAYIELHANVGRSFWAVRSYKRDSEGSANHHPHLDIYAPTRDLGAQDGNGKAAVHKQLQDLRDETTRLLERLEQAKARIQAQTWADTESQTDMIRSIVQDAQTMIKMHQRLLPS